MRVLNLKYPVVNLICTPQHNRVSLLSVRNKGTDCATSNRNSEHAAVIVSHKGDAVSATHIEV